MQTHKPHKQLKAIRARLGITQMQAAAMLGVSYPYLLSVETGQRELSGPLARKIRRTFGVARIQEKNAEPMIRDSKGNLVPFTKERFENYILARPSFFIEDDSVVKLDGKLVRGGKFVTPTPSDYARCTHALLEAAEEQHALRPVVADFFNWFAESITSDAILESLKRKFDKLFPGERRKSDALLSLTVYWEKRLDEEIWKHEKRLAADAKRAARKRRKRLKK